MTWCAMTSHETTLARCCQITPDSTAQECLPYILSACGMTVPRDAIKTLRESNEDQGFQGVYKIAGSWVVRIFKLHDGYRQPAAFMAKVLDELRDIAPVEPHLFHGTLEPTEFQYIVTAFVHGISLTREGCADPLIRTQFAEFLKVVRAVPVPEDVTVVKFMQPRLAKLHAVLCTVSPELKQRIQTRLVPLSVFTDMKMVVCHNDLAFDNILHRGPSISAIIDWEFMSYMPEFADASLYSQKPHQLTWGEDFGSRHGLGFDKYSKEVLFTEQMCFFAELDNGEFSKLAEKEILLYDDL